MILDGWGQRDNFRANSIAAAKTPVMNGLMKNHSSTLLNPKGMYMVIQITLERGIQKMGM